MPSAFIDRIRELAFLEELYASDRAQLYVLYGRRRVGKTELLRAFCQDKPHVYFQAAQVADVDNRRQFQQAIARALAEPLLEQATFENWEAPLEYLARESASQRMIVVLDEFPYLCEANRALPSLLQRFWDQHGQRSRLMCVLCGSSIGFMENEVLAQRSPLFGRRTGQQELLPLGFREASEFLRGYGIEDCFRAWGILGGMPMYQTQLDAGRPLAENVKRHLLRPQALLYEEPMNLLRSELRDPGVYNSILDALASGLTRANEIAQRVGIQSTALSHYLPVLQSLRLVHRVVSASEPSPGKRTRGRYFIADNFLRFWYRFVLPNRSLLEIEEAERVWDERIAPQLDQYLGGIFEEACREYVRQYARERLPALPETDPSPYWHRDSEIDLVCRNADGSFIAGECKWSRRPVGVAVLQDLQQKAQALPADWRRDLRYVIFARSGFTDGLMAQADGQRLLLLDLADLYGQEPAS